MKIKPSTMTSRIALAGLALAVVGGSAAIGADDTMPPGRSIAYAANDIKLSVYQTKDAKDECPHGVNTLGPREQFKLLYPQDAGQKWKFVDTQMGREAEIWWPTLDKAEEFPFIEAEGKTAIGLDLDGKTKPSDFTSPEGKSGVDNQLYRVVGCIMNYRDGASIINSERAFLLGYHFNRLLIELTDVDSLVNDDDVTITTYRGLDALLRDAQGDFQAGGTERIDMRWGGKDFVHTGKGMIVNGVLKSEPMDILVPQQVAFSSAAASTLRGARFDLKLTPAKAEGLIGGYADIESFYRRFNRAWGTHFMSYGQQVPPMVYRALHHLADGYPDPETGDNTAISSSYSVKLVQVRILHAGKEVAETDSQRDARQLAESGTSSPSDAK